MTGDIDRLKFFLSNGMNPMSRTSTKETLLHVASRHKQREIANFLCQSFPSMLHMTDTNQWNAAHYAAMGGDIDCLKTLIDHGIDPMSRTSTQETLLHVAARCKHPETLEYLCKRYTKLIELTDKNQWNAAHYAAMSGDIDCLKTLTHHCIVPLSRTSTQETLLHIAAHYKHQETLQYLCQRYPELIQLTDNNQWNAAHYAAMGGDIDCLNSLIRHGIDPLSRTSTQETLLHIAARCKHPETLQYLCKRNPELIQLTDKNQWNAAHYAAMGGNKDCLDTVIEHGIDPLSRTSTQETLLHVAARWKNPETLEYICKRYPELIELTDNNQWNAAHYAAMDGITDCLKTFLRHGIDPLPSTSTQEILLHVAARCKHLETLQYLCKRYPLLIQFTDKTLWNAAHYAAMDGNIDCLKTLINRGTDSLSRTSTQETLLHIAARFKQQETLEYLCQRYPELIQLTDNKQWNAAHYAAMGGDIDCLKTLIHHGIDPLSRTSTQETLLHVAARFKHHGTLFYLCIENPLLIQLTDKNQWNAAHYAAMDGNIDGLKTLIRHGIDPLSRTSTQETLLHVAARCKHTETLEYMCKRNPELIQLTDKSQWNAAHYAALDGNIDGLKTLIRHGIDPMSRTSTQETLLHVTARCKHTETLECLCKRYPELIQLTDKNQWNAAHYAAMDGNIDGLKTLLDQGIDPLSRTSTQETLLHVAARCKHTETLEYICKRNPELIQLTDKSQWNAAHYAALDGNIDGLKTLIRHGIDPMSRTSTQETLLHVTARCKHTETLECLCKRYPELIQLTDKNQWNAAHYAAMDGNIDGLKTLLDQGIDPMSRTSTQETLLHVAARCKHLETLEYICKRYPELIELTDKNQWNAAHYAAMDGNIDGLKTLLDQGIDPMSRTSTQETLLHVAARCKHLETLECLCKRYPELIQLTDSYQWNAAHYAAMGGNSDCLDTLINHGIDPLSRTSTQETLLHVAAHFNNLKALRYLYMGFPKLIQLTDNNQWNAAHYAAMGGDIYCLQSLIRHAIDPLSRTSKQETLLHLAARYKHRGIVDFLCTRYPYIFCVSDTIELNAARYTGMGGERDCVETLIDHGIDPLSRISTQETPLHVAARFKHRPWLYSFRVCSQLLLLTDTNQWNVAHYAAMGGDIDCLKILIDQGIDPLSTTSTQETLLHIAARCKHPETLEYLCKEYPLLIKLKDTNQWNAAHYAAMGGDVDCLETLIEHGIDPLSRTSTQETLLHVAARYEHRGVVYFLCKSYTYILLQMTYTNPWNAAHYAAMGGDIDCLKTLIDKGIDPMSRTSTQETLLHVATRYKHSEIVEHLRKTYPTMAGDSVNEGTVKETQENCRPTEESDEQLRDVMNSVGEVPGKTENSEGNTFGRIGRGDHSVSAGNIQISEDSEPMITSETYHTMAGDTVKESENYNNFLKVGLALKKLQKGLSPFITRQLQTIHASTLANIGGPYCGTCTTNNILLHPKRNCKIVGCVCWDDQSLSRRPCPTEGCKKFYDVLVQLNGHGTPQMHNVDISTMFHDPWQIAKSFLPPSVNAKMASTNDCDVFGLCSIIINCRGFWNFGISFDNAEVFSQVEDISRDIMHSAVQEVTEQDMILKLDTIVRALQCGPLNHDENAKRAATEIMKMKNSTLSRQMETDVKQEWLKTNKESVVNQLKAMENTEDETRKATKMSVDERQEATVAFLAHSPMEMDKTQSVESKSSYKKTIFGKPFEQSCILDGENTTFQIPGSDVKVIFPNSLTKNKIIEVHGSIFRSIFHIRKRFDLPASEAVASPVTEYHVTGCTKCTDYTCVKMPFVGPRSELKVWKFISDEGITHTTTRLQVPRKGEYSNEHLFYEVEGASTCSVYTRSFSGFFCTTDGHRPLKLRALLYASHKRFQPLSSCPQHEIHIRMYIADEVMKFQDYKQTMDDNETMQDRFQKEDKVLSLLEDDLTEDSNIEASVTPTEDSANQWLHKLEPHSGQPIFAEIQTLPLRDIIQKCPDCQQCHLQSNEIPYSVEWYLTNRQSVIPSLRFKGLVTVDCVKDHQRRSTTLIIDELLLRPEDRFPAEMKDSTLSRQIDTDVKQEWLDTNKESVENQLKAMKKTEDETRKAIEMSVDERQDATVAFVPHPQMEIDKTAESKSTTKKTIFGKPFEQSCILNGEKTTFQIPGSDVKVIFPSNLTKNKRIEVHGSSFHSIFHIRKRFALPTSEAVASPVTEYHVTGCTKCSDYTCVKMPFVGPRSGLKVWKFLSDEGITHTTTRLQVPPKGKDSNEHLFYEVEGASTCSVYTRSFSGFFCTTDGHRPLKLRALLYASHKWFQTLNQHEVRIRMYIADEVMKFQDYKQTMDDIETMQDRFQKEDKVLSLLEDDLTENSNIEVCVTPTEDSSNQWVHKPNPHTGQPIFAEIQMLPLRDILQKCPDCPGCHLQSNEIPYSVEWYLTNRQTVLPSLRFKGLVTVDCVNNKQRRSTALIIDELLLRSTDRLPDEMKNSTLSRQIETDVKQEWLDTNKDSVENQLKAMKKTKYETGKAIEMSVDERQNATVAFVPHPQMEIDKTAERKSSTKKTIFGKPFEQSCILNGENTTFQIPGSDVKVIFPNNLTKNKRIEVHGSSFHSIFHIRKRFALPTSEAVASPVTEYHVTGCTNCSDYTCVKVPFVGPRSGLKVWKFLSDEGITHTTTRLQVPPKGKDSNAHLFYEVEGASTCSVYTRSFSGFFCTTDGHRPLKLRVLLYASHKRFQPLNQHEVRIRMYIADEVMKFQDYKQTMDDIETMQDRFQKEDKVLSLLEDDLTEDSSIEVCVTPTEDSSNQWVHKHNPHTGQPIFAEIQMLPLRDIVQKCPDCPGCHLQSNEIPYSVEWYLTNRQTELPSLRFKGLVTVDCVNNKQRRSTALIIDELLLRSTDRLPDEEIDEYDRLRQIKGFVMRMGADKRQKLLEFFGLGPTFVNKLFDDLQRYYKPAGVFPRLVEAFSQQLLYEELDRLFYIGLISEQYCQRPVQRAAHTNVSYSPDSSRHQTVTNDNFLRAPPTRNEGQSYPRCHPGTRDASDVCKVRSMPPMIERDMFQEDVYTAGRLNQAAAVDPTMADGSVNEENVKTKMAEGESSNKQTIFGKPFEYSCVLDGENTTFQIPGSDVQVIFPNSLTKNNRIEVQGSSFRSIFHIRKRFDLPPSEALASPVTEYHVTGCTKSLDYACVKMPFVGSRSELKVWKFLSDDGITHATTRMQVPLKGKDSNEHSPDMFYEIEGSSTCLVYTRSFSCFYCTTDGRRPLKLRAFSYASHKRFPSTGSCPRHEVRIRMYIADEVMKFKDYKQRMDDTEKMQDRCRADEKVLSLFEALTRDNTIEAYVTPTEDSDNQWVHMPKPKSNEPMFPEKQTLPLRDIVQQCPNCPRCHLQSDELPYCLEWYLTNRQGGSPSLNFQSLLTVDSFNSQEKRSTILIIDKLKIQQEDDVPAEETPRYNKPTEESDKQLRRSVNSIRGVPDETGNSDLNTSGRKRPRDHSIIRGTILISAEGEPGIKRQMFTEGANMKKPVDDTMDQYLVTSLKEHMHSVGALVHGDRGHGTVFRVGSKYVMTAKHVVTDIIDPGRTGLEDVNLLKGNDVHVTFSGSLYQPGPFTYKIKEITYDNQALDVAILEIENYHTTAFPSSMVLCKCPLDQAVTEISLIGFGHPNSHKKHLDQRCRIKYNDDVYPAVDYLRTQRQIYMDQVRRHQGNNPHIVSSVDHLYGNYDNPDKLLWSCYMENGGSGSPVINHNNHRSLKVVALYTQAIPYFLQYLDQVDKRNYPCDKRFEMGPRMSSIFLDMQQRNEQLANELFPGGC